MMNKMSQIEKNMFEFQRRELKKLKDSGMLKEMELRKKQIDALITPQMLQQLADIKKPVKITPIDVENMKPTDKRIRKAEELLYNYTFQNKDAEPDDILKSLETIGSSRVKATTKPPTGMTLNQKNKIRSIQREYARLTKTKTPQRAKNMLVKKHDLKLSTIETYLKTDF